MNFDFGTWLKKRRRALDLTQADLAARATCSVNTIRKIESSDLTPSKALAFEIARAVEIPESARAAFVTFARTPNAVAAVDDFVDTPRARETAVPTERLYAGVKFRAPAPLTAALGREHDTAVIARTLRLPATRLVTLTGPPGTGKTRLALEVANEIQDEFEHGAAFVALAPISNAASVEAAIAHTLDVRDAAAALTPALQNFLRDKNLLLVLDNFEHVLDAAPLVNDLLRNAPRLKILTTSRERLRVYSEREIPLAPLAVPALDPLPPRAELENVPAIQLFIERAQAVNPTFGLTDENAGAVAHIVVGLDGLPLAIEMAAPRLKFETPQQLVTQLAQRLETFSSKARDIETRQRTLRDAMNWSYQLLDETEQRVFRALGMFRGGFTAPAANAVCGKAVDEILQTLVEKSLVKRERGDDDAVRYDLLEMIREYALAQLERAGELQHVRARHAAHFAARAHSIAYAREYGASRAQQKYDLRDAENYRLASEWCAEHDAAAAVTLAFDLADFWVIGGLARQAAEQLTQLLPRVQGTPAYITGLLALAELALQQGDFDLVQSSVEQVLALTAHESVSAARAQALRRLGYVALMRGDFTRAQELFEHARTQYQQLGLRSHEARALNNLGLVAKDRGELERAEEYHHAALALRRELGLQSEIAQSLFNLAIVAYWRGDYARAIQVGMQAYELYVDDAGDYGASYVLETIGMAHFKLGDYARALEALTKSLALLRPTNDKRGLALVLHALGDVALAQGELENAQASYREALAYCLYTGEKRRAAFCLEGFAATLQRTGEIARAATLFGAADALRQATGAMLYESERAAYLENLQDLRNRLAPQEFERQWQNGQALDMSRAIELALQ